MSSKLYPTVRAFVRANPGVEAERVEKIYGAKAVEDALNRGQITATFLNNWDPKTETYVQTGTVLDAR